MSDKFTINLSIAEEILRLRINREDEELARKAGKSVSELFAKYKAKYENSELSYKDFLLCVAFQFAYGYYQLSDEKSIDPLLERINDLNADLESFLKEKQ